MGSFMLCRLRQCTACRAERHGQRQVYPKAASGQMADDIFAFPGIRNGSERSNFGKPRDWVFVVPSRQAARAALIREEAGIPVIATVH